MYQDTSHSLGIAASNFEYSDIQFLLSFSLLNMYIEYIYFCSKAILKYTIYICSRFLWSILQKRWAQKEKEVREELKRARLLPGAPDLGAIQGKAQILTPRVPQK